MSEAKSTIGVYAGSFDPVTKGHLDVIHRAAKLFSKLYIVVGVSSDKEALFSEKERKELLLSCCGDLKNVTIQSHSGLTVEFAKSINADVLIRGIRSGADYTYEMSMAQMNRQLGNNIETIFIPTHSEYFHLSSTLVKDVAKHGGDLSELVPPLVHQKLSEKYRD